MKYQEVIEIEKMAALCRNDALKTVQIAGSGHLGGSLSVMDILAVLYFHTMRIDPKDPHDPARDRCVLSKGHCTPAMYSILARKGFFPLDDLKTFRRIDGDLSGHVEMTKVNGVDMSTGSLGQGLSAALGMALAARIDKLDYNVYCICGDGEIQEGQIWEAAQVAAHYNAHNLVAIIDNNHIQLDGFTETISGVQHTAEKFKAFGWNVLEINGHSIPEISAALDMASNCRLGPTAIIANTVKGKGVSFMENDPKWHGGYPSEEEFAQAFTELNERINHLSQLSQETSHE